MLAVNFITNKREQQKRKKKINKKQKKTTTMKREETEARTMKSSASEIPTFGNRPSREEKELEAVKLRIARHAHKELK